MSILINKNNSGDVQVIEDGKTQTLFPNMEGEGGGGSGGGAVDSVNGKTGVVVLDAEDVGAVGSVNGKTGTVVLTPSDIGASPENAVDISSIISLTKGTNCDTVTLNSAYQMGSLIGVQITVKPDSSLASGSVMIVNIVGVNPVNPNVGLGFGLKDTNIFFAWVDGSAKQIKIRNMSSTWGTSDSITLSVFFVATPVNIPDDSYPSAQGVSF